MTEGKKMDEPGKFRQILVALIANMSTLSFGTMISWPSSMIPQLQSETPPVGNEPMTDEAASWLTGIMCLVSAVVSLAVGGVANRFGCKVTGYLMGVPLCACWLFTIFATEQAHLFVARFFAGMSGGMALFLVPVYVSEIASDGIRGMLGSLLIFLLNGGILLGYVLGALLSYRVYSIVALLFSVLYLALFVFLPESPVYLTRRNRLNEAARSISWLRGDDKPTVEQEWLRLQAEVRKQNIPERTVKLSDLFRDRATIKGSFITLGLFAGQQLAGISVVLSYTGTIFKMSGSSLSPDSSAIIIGLIQVFGSCLSTMFMERAGRRPLLLISSSVMAICHCVLGIFCYLQTFRYDVSRFGSISIVALSVYMIAYGLGLGPGPYIICSEILKRDVTNLLTTIAMCFAWCTAFVTVKLFPSIIALLGMHGSFFLLGTFCTTTFVFVFTFVPETKNLPRQVIIDRLNGLR
ncbi:unnamed protein product [Xylocopa violacea]|uniref:Major facilitator superfamily (MFS) profile domain-containing protein n=1 Tax=Xylocopa violacea TaxID=135666 RepID=A0ABP1N444_XYLVO